LTLELWTLPPRWSTRLQKAGLPRFLDELEAEARSGAPVRVSVARIAKLVDWRTKLTAGWRRNRCLLRSLLLTNLLVRAGVPVTLHISCKSVNGGIRGHSWITSPVLGEPDDAEEWEDSKEIISKTVLPALAPLS
jgi:hypothetical protein